MVLKEFKSYGVKPDNIFEKIDLKEAEYKQPIIDDGKLFTSINNVLGSKMFDSDGKVLNSFKQNRELMLYFKDFLNDVETENKYEPKNLETHLLNVMAKENYNSNNSGAMDRFLKNDYTSKEVQNDSVKKKYAMVLTFLGLSYGSALQSNDPDANARAVGIFAGLLIGSKEFRKITFDKVRSVTANFYNEMADRSIKKNNLEKYDMWKQKAIDMSKKINNGALELSPAIASMLKLEMSVEAYRSMREKGANIPLIKNKYNIAMEKLKNECATYKISWDSVIKQENLLLGACSVIEAKDTANSITDKLFQDVLKGKQDKYYILNNLYNRKGNNDVTYQPYVCYSGEGGSENIVRPPFSKDEWVDISIDRLKNDVDKYGSPFQIIEAISKEDEPNLVGEIYNKHMKEDGYSNKEIRDMGKVALLSYLRLRCFDLADKNRADTGFSTLYTELLNRCSDKVEMNKAVEETCLRYKKKTTSYKDGKKMVNKFKNKITELDMPLNNSMENSTDFLNNFKK